MHRLDRPSLVYPTVKCLGCTGHICRAGLREILSISAPPWLSACDEPGELLVLTLLEVCSSWGLTILYFFDRNGPGV